MSFFVTPTTQIFSAAAAAPLCHPLYPPTTSGPSFLSKIKHAVLDKNRSRKTASEGLFEKEDIVMGHSQSKQKSTSNSRRMSWRSSRSNTSSSYHPASNDRSFVFAYPKAVPSAGAAGVAGVAPPPPYTAAPNAQPLASNSAATDDAYGFLSTFDTVFLIDDSGSMAGRSWRETKDALETIIPVCVQHDADGIDIYFLNARDSPYHHNITSPSTVREIFSSVQPHGSTPTGQRLAQILKPYLLSCSQSLDRTKPLNIIVITDGVPTDDVESALIHAAKKLDRLDAPAWQVGVQFFQVGSDEDAKTHLRALDDELSEIAGGEVRDMVDTVPFLGRSGEALTGEGILKVVLGAVNRRLDRKRSKDLHR